MSNARNLANLLSSGSGSVLQVRTATTDNQQAISTSTTWSDITGLTVNITPTATSNKILVMGKIFMGNGSNPNGGFGCYRSETSGGGNASFVGSVSVGDSDYIRGDGFYSSDEWYYGINHSLVCVPFFLEDTAPSTNQLTYKLQMAASDSSSTQYINYPSNGTASGRGRHSITVMEVKA
jgi:hypothetical protein|tara:strand:- start:369 stop:905 length:537 start_codon:yes stop_codon:yes gene_type:complete